MIPKLIALEEHYISHFCDASDAALPPRLTVPLNDLNELRLKDMDVGKTSLQVISHSPSATPVEGCRQSNDKLAAACRQHPDRFAGFANLPMQDPQAAVLELERAVRDLGFVGALVNNHTSDGSMYDDERFWPVFEKAVELDVPIYMHPTFPPKGLASHYNGNFGPTAAGMMSTAGWGWHAECGLHFFRLYASGLFDRCPDLKLILGHAGEMLPFMIERNYPVAFWLGKFERDMKTVWRENIWVTTSGFFTLAPFECLIKTKSLDKIMFSVDYPYSTTTEGYKFVEEIERSGLLSQEQLEAFCHGNAERLLRVKAKSLN